jgi:hypothetical protein
LYFRLAAHACRIDKANVLAAPLQFDGDRIARDAGLRPRQQTLLSDQAIDERGLARVRTADDCDGERAPRRIFVFDFFVVFETQLAAQRLIQIGESVAMLRSLWHRIAKAEAERIICAGHSLFAFRLVGDQHDRFSGFADDVGEMLVFRRDARPRIDDEKNSVGIVDRGDGLGCHARGKRAFVGGFQARGIDGGKFKIADLCLAFAAVARHAGLIVDKRDTLADQPVKERGLADVRTADNGDD